MTVAPDPGAQLLDAEREAELARQRLSTTVGELQARLDPRLLKQQAADVGSQAAQASIDSVRRNPGMVAGAAAALTLFLARRPIARLVRRVTRRDPVTRPASRKD